MLNAKDLLQDLNHMQVNPSRRRRLRKSDQGSSWSSEKILGKDHSYCKGEGDQMGWIRLYQPSIPSWLCK
ncbi:hypothetical protein Nmel_011047 [Mimus melanotis]